MKTLDVVLLVLAAVAVAVVAVGAGIARRRAEAREGRLLERLATADAALAAAHAADNGWARDVLDAAALAAAGPTAPDALQLVQVIDRPGTEADEAVYRAVFGAETREIRLGRTGDSWFAV